MSLAELCYMPEDELLPVWEERCIEHSEEIAWALERVRRGLATAMDADLLRLALPNGLDAEDEEILYILARIEGGFSTEADADTLEKMLFA